VNTWSRVYGCRPLWLRQSQSCLRLGQANNRVYQAYGSSLIASRILCTNSVCSGAWLVALAAMLRR
jgi:hypothetical protein